MCLADPPTPVERPLTEPDIALHLPGRYLILIEAKFTSPNTYYVPAKRAKPSDLLLAELVDLYQDPGLQMLDVEKAARAPRVYQQLWRNLTFAEWMGRQDQPRTKAYHVNLIRQGYDQASADEFSGLVRAEFLDRFQQITWESIYKTVADAPSLITLRRYLERKTAGLRPAFQIG